MLHGAAGAALAAVALPGAALAVPPPTVTGPSGPINAPPTYTISSDRPLAEVSWTVSGPVERSGSGTTAAPDGLPDGDYVFAARQSVLLGESPNPSPPATVAFTLDRVAPAAPVVIPPPSPGDDPTPRVAWAGEPGGRYSWRILRGGIPIRGPLTTPDREAAVAPALGEGAYVLEVRQSDDAGNEGPAAAAAFTVAPAGAPAAIGAAGATPPDRAAPASPSPRTPAPRPRPAPGTLFAERLGPVAGSLVRTLRPVLRWRGRPGGTTLFNVQIFDRRGKVLSAFPRGLRYRVRPGVLRPGTSYVWRVWPYRGRLGYAIRPFGVSTFRTAPRARTVHR
jgi:hypothetical protein